MSERATNRELQHLVDRLNKVGRDLELLSSPNLHGKDEVLALVHGSGVQGIPWTLGLFVRPVLDDGYGLSVARTAESGRTLDFMPHDRFLGRTKSRARDTLRSAVAALEAADRAMKLVADREEKIMHEMVHGSDAVSPPF